MVDGYNLFELYYPLGQSTATPFSGTSTAVWVDFAVSCVVSFQYGTYVCHAAVVRRSHACE